MIDFKGNPFYLNDTQIAWVQSTLASMTDDEKIGQLFCPISYFDRVAGTMSFTASGLMRCRQAGWSMCPTMKVLAPSAIMPR